MTSKVNKRSNTQGNPDLIEHDAIIAEAIQVKGAWQRGETTLLNADAKAIHVLVRAYASGFFSGKVNLAVLHKMEKKAIGEAWETIIVDLFQAETTGAIKQRLARIKCAVVAVIKVGGLSKITLAKSGALLLDTETALYKKIEKREGKGQMEVSVAKLISGARSYLISVKELSKAAGTTKNGQGKTAKPLTATALSKTSRVKVAKDLAHKLGNTTIEKVKEPERKILRSVLVELLALFAGQGDGETFDAVKITSIYQEEKTAA